MTTEALDWQREARRWAVPRLLRMLDTSGLDDTDYFLLTMAIALGVESVFARHGVERAERKLLLLGMNPRDVFGLLARFRDASNDEILLHSASTVD